MQIGCIRLLAGVKHGLQAPIVTEKHLELIHMQTPPVIEKGKISLLQQSGPQVKVLLIQPHTHLRPFGGLPGDIGELSIGPHRDTQRHFGAAANTAQHGGKLVPKRGLK